MDWNVRADDRCLECQLKRAVVLDYWEEGGQDSYYGYAAETIVTVFRTRRNKIKRTYRAIYDTTDIRHNYKPRNRSKA